jgi:predicted transposase YdaD
LEFIRDNRVYQEAKEEGVMQTKLEMIPILSGLGFGVEH